MFDYTFVLFCFLSLLIVFAPTIIKHFKKKKALKCIGKVYHWKTKLNDFHFQVKSYNQLCDQFECYALSPLDTNFKKTTMGVHPSNIYMAKQLSEKQLNELLLQLKMQQHLDL